MKELLAYLFLVTSLISKGETVSKNIVLMGSAFSFTAVHQEKNKAWSAINGAIQEVTRIENLISSWNPNSETSKINENAGLQPTIVSKELIQLIRRSIKISELSNGAFDISFASLKPVWDFNSPINQLPNSNDIQSSVSLINWKEIELTDSTVFLKNKGMKIDFGAIGKGYAANQAKETMINHGIKSGVVNAGGDLNAWGQKENNQPWKVGIADPLNTNNILSWINITNTAVVTSGNYEKFIEIDGVKYCHIINPKTGWPVQKLQSVTIICPNAELADALATTVFVLGKNDGLKLTNQLKGIEAIIIDKNNQLHYSTNVKTNLITP